MHQDASLTRIIYNMQMEEKLKKAFSRAKYEPGIDLADNVWRVIILGEKHSARLKLFVFSSMGFASLVGLVSTFRVLLSDFTQSGLYYYISLLFSDSKFILSYWREFAVVLGESLPVESIILSLCLVFILFLSLRYIMKQIDQLILSF